MNKSFTLSIIVGLFCQTAEDKSDIHQYCSGDKEQNRVENDLDCDEKAS